MIHLIVKKSFSKKNFELRAIIPGKFDISSMFF